MLIFMFICVDIVSTMCYNGFIKTRKRAERASFVEGNAVSFVQRKRGCKMNGFLDREGKLHPCSSWEHLDKAAEIAEAMGVKVYNRLDAEEYLKRLGWIVVRSRDVYGLIGLRIDGKRLHLTDAQKDFLNKLYGEVNGSCQKSIDELFENDK